MSAAGSKYFFKKFPEREFPVLLMPTPKKKKKKIRGKTKQNTQKHENTPQNKQKHPKNTKKTTPIFFALTREKKTSRVTKKIIYHPAQNGMKPSRVPL